jgi:hypothetical protein
MEGTPENRVYLRLIRHLSLPPWSIICASPPEGTDNRFRKCIFPRRDLQGAEKGARDEVDLIAFRPGALVLFECKPTLTDSLARENRLGENDYMKLRRIRGAIPSASIVGLLNRAYSLAIPLATEIAIGLAVEIIDAPLPPDASVFELNAKTTIVHLAAPLSNH